ncbi:ER lumen protein-retaining receptor erd-2.2-like [Cajanus cajan]|uniref:ER lumen protein-retaining receptor erd-2.2-like n=1 Tax=Cajanus cajan TaxID=3821 RepID=UPI00098DB4F5|nr:ER lumen protein-retaining receptor erd-2.2-like [Cajanus cajan]
MGTKRGYSQVNVLFERLMRNLSLKVKIFLGAFLAVCAIVVIRLSMQNFYFFFIASEVVHAVGIIVLAYKLFALKTCSGLSLITQELTAIYLAARLSCSNLTLGNIHTLLDLISFLSTLLVIWMIRFRLKSSYIKELDNKRLYFLVVPVAILAILIHPYTANWNITRIVWAFSLYLESISVLPQLRFMQNAKMIETFTGYYVFALGVSRIIALAHWIIRIYLTRGAFLFMAGSGYFWFLAGFLAEIVQSFILADFCYYYMKSFLQGQLLRKMPV